MYVSQIEVSAIIMLTSLDALRTPYEQLYQARGIATRSERAKYMPGNEGTWAAMSGSILTADCAKFSADSARRSMPSSSCCKWSQLLWSIHGAVGIFVDSTKFTADSAQRAVPSSWCRDRGQFHMRRSWSGRFVRLRKALRLHCRLCGLHCATTSVIRSPLIRII